MISNRVSWVAGLCIIAGPGLVFGARRFQRSATDFQLRCETLAEAAISRSAKLQSVSAMVERTIPLPGSPIGLLGAEWLPDHQALAVFEGQDSRISLLDSVGRLVQTIGRHGEGPAEFRLSPVYLGSRQKFRFAPDQRLLALDDRFGHVFSGGKQIQEVLLGPTARGLVTDAHVARIWTGWIVSQGQRYSSDPAIQSSVELYLVPDTTTPRLKGTLLGTVRNPAWTPGSTEGAFRDGPYGDLYRRTWDARAKQMAVLSSKGFSVCFGDPNAPGTWRAWSAAASPRRVDARERDRILKQRFGRTTGLAPMMNIPVERIFEGKWPQHTPYYYDVTALGDTMFAAMRLDSVQGVAADLFQPAKGYLGTIILPQERYLIGGYASGLLLLDPQEGTVELLRLRSR